MAVNKVVYGGNTLIDITNDTVTANTLRSGVTAHNKGGTVIFGSMPEQATQTITPGIHDQTIYSGRYLTGNQIVKGDTDLVASNIRKGINIFGIAGTMVEGASVFSGSGIPNSGLGVNGDIYVKTK